MTFAHLLLSVACFVIGVWQAVPASYGSETGFQSDYETPDVESTFGMEKRYGINLDCRRCMFRRDDWRSCWSCYNRPGPIPFYGGFAKRSETPWPAASRDYDSRLIRDSTAAEKRSFDACRCCLRSPSVNSQCCQSCYLVPFYDGYKKRSPEISADDEASFVPVELSGAGLCDRCCNGPTFDFYCCVFSCGEKRRK